MILKEIEMDMVDHKTCENKLQGTILGEKFQLDKSFNCAIGKYGIDTCTGSKVIGTKYSKHWPYTVAHTIDCVCRKC